MRGRRGLGRVEPTDGPGDGAASFSRQAGKQRDDGGHKMLGNIFKIRKDDGTTARLEEATRRASRIAEEQRRAAARNIRAGEILLQAARAPMA